MYAHANLRDKCLLLVLSQSGFSEVDVSEFRLENMKGIYEAPISTHFFFEKQREKTGETQATCLSYEALHDIKAMLAENATTHKRVIFSLRKLSKKT